MKNESAGFFANLRKMILPEKPSPISKEVTNNHILGELIACFDESLRKESVGTSMLFNTHYIILMHPDTFENRRDSLPVIVKEAVKSFYGKLKQLRSQYEDISPISSQWHFKFGSAAEFNSETLEIHDIKVVGMLTGEKETVSATKAKVTMKPKKSDVYDKMDINLDAFRQIDFRESGAFAVPFNSNLQMGNETLPKTSRRDFANIEYFLADKNVEETYIMKDKEIVIARKEAANQNYSNYLLVDSPYVSDPHARIRYNESSHGFQIASFSRNETRVNERVIPRSELGSPQWFDMKANSQILLNGLITLTFQSNQSTI